MSNSTRSGKRRNPQSLKPYPDFPLSVHPTRRWCKKVRGKLHYFGRLDDGWQPALELWEKQKPFLLTGRPVPVDDVSGDDASDDAKRERGYTVRDLVIAYLKHQKSQIENRELTIRTFADCHRTCEHIVSHFKKHKRLDDIRESDFAAYRSKLATKLSLGSLKNEIGRSKGVFKFGKAKRMFKEDVPYGVSFKPPSESNLKREQNAKPKRRFIRDGPRRTSRRHHPGRHGGL